MKMEGLYSALQPRADNTSKQHAGAPVRYHKVLYMVENERMGGKVPIWKTEPVNTTERSSKGFETALNNALNGEDLAVSDAAIALNPADSIDAEIDDKPFGFGDLVDMANPLHHIPLVNYAYREITGDQIRPISQIVGGAIYGGPVGAAGGVINVAIKEETGRDVGEHAIAAVSGRTATYAKNKQELPPSLLVYSAPDLPRTQTSAPKHKPVEQAVTHDTYAQRAPAPAYREPITELLLNTQRKTL